MKLLIRALFVIYLALTATQARADHHESQAAALPENSFAAINLCHLNEGKTMSDVARLNEKWFAWTKSENMEPFSLLLTPFVTASSRANPGYDFIEIITNDYETGGRLWQAALRSKKGLALDEEWREITTCYTRINHLVFKYMDQAALSSTDERIVTFNRCEIREGVTGDQMRAVHQRGLDRRSEQSTNIFWGLLLPAAGGPRGEFRHMMTYPDFPAYTASLSNSLAGSAFRREYNTHYAQCDGPSVWVARVQHRPGG